METTRGDDQFKAFRGGRGNREEERERTRVKYRFIADLNRFLYCFGVTMASEKETKRVSWSLADRVEAKM